MKNAIAVSHLTRDYGSFKLDDVSFTLPGGAILGLIGENGAGKTTTIKCLLDLVHPDGGAITLLDRDAARESSAIREEIGVVLDESSFHDALRPRDADKILGRIYRNWDSPLFRRICARFSLPWDKTVKTFSRGMKMKLSIAAALSHHPRLLLLDEATGGLDPVVRDELLDEFLAFIGDEDHSILLSSHITSDLEKCADYIVYLHQGRVVLQGAKDELLENYGRLVCTRAELEGLDQSRLRGLRVGRFGCEALIQDRRAFARRHPGLTVDPVTLEDIMVFTVRGDSK